jgi:hypothetical protein
MPECDICNKYFKTSYLLDRHKNKKYKCNIVTPYQCINCNKYFRQKKNMDEHIIKQTCKNDNELNNNEYINNKTFDDDIKIALKSILVSKIDDDEKIELLKISKLNIDDAKLKKILVSAIDIEGKISILKEYKDKSNANMTNQSNISNTSNTNNGSITTETNSHNNITQNIQINNFGKEDISYLDNEYFKNLIMNQHIEKGYVQLIKDIYLNKDHPENSTVKVENINNKYAHVFNNGKWDAILKADLKEELHKKNYTVLKMHYDKLKKSMSVPKREETYTFLKRDDFSDPHMMYVIDKIILLFYNDDVDEDLLEKSKINKNI